MMAEVRLKARIQVQAALRRCDGQGIAAAVLHRGDPDAGAILVKLNLLGGGFLVLSQSRDAEGQPVWRAATGEDPVQEERADAYIARERAIDRDLWVIEVETRTVWNPFAVD